MLLDKIINFLNNISQDYRAVARHLKKARRERRLKEDASSASSSRDLPTSVEDNIDGKVG